MSSGTVHTIRPAPVRKQLTVEASPEQAFEVFTAGFGGWWPPSHHIGAGAYKTAVIEPRVGGRWYEVGQDGSECDWGDVLVWDPPGRLVLAWRLSADWKYQKDLLTEVEVKFTAEGARTLVELEHRKLENWGAGAGQAHAAIDGDGGWSGLLKMYAAGVAAG
jgi:uncharacterized protein YndB with AHSA1/START domain